MIVPGVAPTLTFITASPVTVPPSQIPKPSPTPRLRGSPTARLSLPSENVHLSAGPEHELSSSSSTFDPSSKPTVPELSPGLSGTSYSQLSLIYSPALGVVLLTHIVRPFGPVAVPSAATAVAAVTTDAHPARTAQAMIRLKPLRIFVLPFRSLVISAQVGDPHQSEDAMEQWKSPVEAPIPNSEQPWQSNRSAIALTIRQSRLSRASRRPCEVDTL